MIEDTKAAVKEEMRLTAESYKACLAQVEMERAILNEELAQKDVEIAKLTTIIEELKSTAETQVISVRHQLVYVSAEIPINEISDIVTSD